ncbi:hypothetical protein HK405_000468, partial [Cladochytrium tenue]
ARLVPAAGAYPLGFRAGAVHAGLKKRAGALDLALFASDPPCAAAAVFTKNAFAAAPVQVDRKILAANGAGRIRGLVVNSGCANACTGEAGLADAWATAAFVDRLLGAGSGSEATPASLVMSTGVIGQPLKMAALRSGLDQLAPRLGATHEAWLAAAEGVMTTDTFPKLRSREFPALPSSSSSYRMAGFCKGAGMIHPNMATMLAAVFTDAAVSRECLQLALAHAAARSFNAVSVDGDTSTNDSFAVFANGAASGGAVVDDPASPAFRRFRDDLTEFAVDLAKLIVRDGEGATKFITVRVEGAKTTEEARTVASAIARSPLVKTAVYGRDANWGRIVCAVGYSGAEVDPSRVNLHLSSPGGE